MFYSLFSIVPKLLDRKIRIAYSFNVIASLLLVVLNDI